MQSEYNLYDVVEVGIVIAIVQELKKYVNDRWVPVIPILVSFPVAMLSTAAQVAPCPLVELLAKSVWEAVKVAFAAMGGFKIWHTTIKGG